MATNPDTQGADALVPFLGMLRYVDHGVFKTLQQFSYCGSLNVNDWYDVPIVRAVDTAVSAHHESNVVETVDDVAQTASDVDSTAEIIEAGERADVSEVTPPQTEADMIAASKHAPKRVDRSPPHAS